MIALLFLFLSTVKADAAAHVEVPDSIHLKYTYTGLTGPFYWSKIASTCAGKIQSPINFEPFSRELKAVDGILKNPDNLYPDINWKNTLGNLTNLGHTVQFSTNSAEESYFLRANNGKYKLLQWHIHVPSEHRLNGLDYAAEVHFVHAKVTGDVTDLAVVGGWIDVGYESTDFIKNIVNNLPLEKGEVKSINVNYNTIYANLKNSGSFFRYKGSLTTPPCTEGVKWLVATKPIGNIAYGDLLKLQAAFTYNARITMPFASVYDETWKETRKSDYFPEKPYENPSVAVDPHATVDSSHDATDDHASTGDNTHAPAEDTHAAPADTASHEPAAHH